MLEKNWASPEDFATLFQYLWYQDFPIDARGAIGANRSDWTKHIDGIISKIAEFLGLVTRFERRGKIDAILRSTAGDEIAIEWEWGKNWDKELEKLYEYRKMSPKNKGGLQYAVLITYTDNIGKSYEYVMGKWKDSRWPLLLILIEEIKVSKNVYSSGRKFEYIHMYQSDRDKLKKPFRFVRALPWEIAGTTWSYRLK